MRRLLLLLLLTSAVLGALTPPGTAEPATDVSAPLMAHSLDCHGLGAAGPEPVLLIRGTTLSAATNFDWNYARAFQIQRRPYCRVTLPNHGMSDIQIAAEYVAYALRTMHHISARRIQVVGYSQGGMITRWVLKYWPVTRRWVDDVVGIDPSNHGTLDTAAVCAVACAAALWQQGHGSALMRALNAGPETWPGISYTQVYSRTDEVVVPNFGAAASSRLKTGGGLISNIAVQSICPLDVSEHLVMGTTDPVAYAVVMDALTHAGPAKASRILRATCGQIVMPAVSMTSLLFNEARVASEVVTSIATAPLLFHEPPLRSYAR